MPKDDMHEFNDNLKDVRDKAASVIIRMGGSTSPRQLAKHLWRFRRCAPALLQTMVDRDYGQWLKIPPGPKGGRPSTVFALNDSTIRRIGETHPDAPHDWRELVPDLATETDDIGETEVLTTGASRLTTGESSEQHINSTSDSTWIQHDRRVAGEREELSVPSKV